MKNHTIIKINKLKELPRAAKKIKKCCFLAGGTDLVIALKENKARDFDAIIDISGIVGANGHSPLRGITEDKKNIYIGALTTISEVQNSAIIKNHAPALARASSMLGSKQIRNMATLGGNIATASPVGDTLPPLYVYGAKIVITNGKGQRIVPLEKFITGYRKTILKNGEILKTVIIPKTKNNFSVFKKSGQRKAVVISKASLAVNGLKVFDKIKEIKIALGSVGPRIIRARKTENFLRGKNINGDAARLAANLLKKEITPITDLRSNIEYRTHICGEFLKEALMEFAKQN